MSEQTDLDFLIQRCRDQEKLLIAYRVATLRPPEKAIDRLSAGRERFDALAAGSTEDR